jgi:hypothetical protein
MTVTGFIVASSSPIVVAALLVLGFGTIAVRWMFWGWVAERVRRMLNRRRH